MAVEGIAPTTRTGHHLPLIDKCAFCGFREAVWCRDEQQRPFCCTGCMIVSNAQQQTNAPQSDWTPETD